MRQIPPLWIDRNRWKKIPGWFSSMRWTMTEKDGKDFYFVWVRMRELYNSTFPNLRTVETFFAQQFFKCIARKSQLGELV